VLEHFNRIEPYQLPSSSGSIVPSFSVGKYPFEKARRSKFGCKTRNDSEKAVAKAERSEVVEVGLGAVGTGGWVLAESLWTLAKRHCGLRLAGQCCPAPALCEGNSEPARYSTVESLSLDLGGKQ